MRHPFFSTSFYQKWAVLMEGESSGLGVMGEASFMDL